MTQAKQKKHATRGAKQIVEENESTVKFYRNMCLEALAIYFLIFVLLGYEFTVGTIVLIIISIIVYVVCYNLLRYAAKATYSSDGKILDSGTDLNMEGGIAEHVKDMIILTAITQCLSLVSGYFWLLLLLAPARAFLILWKSFLAPWIFQSNAPNQPEVDEKKQRRNERKHMQ